MPSEPSKLTSLIAIGTLDIVISPRFGLIEFIAG
jgi:hypothetical protein